MAPIATVAGFNLTPVKSTALQHPETIDLRVDGAVGDRRFVFARDDGSRLHATQSPSAKAAARIKAPIATGFTGSSLGS